MIKLLLYYKDKRVFNSYKMANGNKIKKQPVVKGKIPGGLSEKILTGLLVLMILSGVYSYFSDQAKRRR